MKNIFNNIILNTLILVILSIVAILTKEIVAFCMLGFVLIMLSNIYDKLVKFLRKRITNKPQIQEANSINQNLIILGAAVKEEIVATASFRYNTCVLSSVAEYMACNSE